MTVDATTDPTPHAQLDGFIDRFAPDVAALTRALMAKAVAQLPGAGMPRRVTSCFTRRDPKEVLQGAGRQIRHIRLLTPDAGDAPDVEAFVRQALARAERPIDPADEGGIVVKPIPAKQRARRP